MKIILKRMITVSFLLPAGMTLLSIVYVMECFELNFGTILFPAEGFAPSIFGTILLGGSCWLTFDTFIKSKKSALPTQKTRPERTETRNILMLVLLMGILLSHVILLVVLGFSFANFITVVASAKLMGAKWRSSLLLAVGVTTVSYLLFIYWLRIPFPSPPFFI